MKTLHFDCFAGISGDMTLGALVDLGVDPEELRAELSKLGFGGWKLEFSGDTRCGITGTRAHVVIEDHHHEHGHEHRFWKDIRCLIENCGISPEAKKRALDIFSRIAAAESQVHGFPEDEITFHEVGALDSIIDIVGTAICLDSLKPDRISCGEIELGGGTVRCAHGELPVPAPATLILCRGLPVKTGGFDKEMTTPTGAAILAASVDEFISPRSTAGEARSFTEIKSAYGIGGRKLDKPNVLRVSWRDEAASPAKPWLSEELLLMEAAIDDMTGEELGFLMERFFASGALDVNLIPCVMKKSRPGTIVQILAPSETSAPGVQDVLRELFFRLSSTAGFRETAVRRHSLRRKERVKKGKAAEGEFRIKEVFYGKTAEGEEAVLRSKIEYEDRARLARERGVSLEEAKRLIADLGDLSNGT
jgi:uncharacterized protein (TIGR00299 family) protein